MQDQPLPRHQYGPFVLNRFDPKILAARPTECTICIQQAAGPVREIRATSDSVRNKAQVVRRDRSDYHGAGPPGAGRIMML